MSILQGFATKIFENKNLGTLKELENIPHTQDMRKF